jgi:hypothetical protein
MFRSLHMLVALLLIIGTGLAHGLWTHRWLHTDEPQASAARLNQLPLEFGTWRGMDSPVPPSALAIGEIVNYKQRRYFNRATGAEFTVLVVCGKPGPISVHTPEVCFPGAGFRMIGEPSAVSLALGDDFPQAEFRTARFQKQNSTEKVEMEAFWSWTTDGHWEAPSYPRLTYGRFPALFKVYIIRMVNSNRDAPEEDLKGARAFMVELTKAIQSNSQE